MVGDYYRYISENVRDIALEEACANVIKAYELADNVELPYSNPLKLGLALNRSVFY